MRIINFFLLCSKKILVQKIWRWNSFSIVFMRNFGIIILFALACTNYSIFNPIIDHNVYVKFRTFYISYYNQSKILQKIISYYVYISIIVSKSRPIQIAFMLGSLITKAKKKSKIHHND